MAGGGQVSVRVIFPSGVAPQPATLPQVTASVKLTLTPEPAPEPPPWVIERLLVAPPRGGPVTAEVREVPAGGVRMVAEAFATSDGTGEVIARAEVVFEVAAGRVTRVGMTTEALCTLVVVRPADLTIAPGKSARLEATAYDADGNVLLGAVFDWRSSDRDVAPVNASTGEVQGAAEGAASITAQERVTGKSGSCAVTVETWSDVLTLDIPVTSVDGVQTPVLQAGQLYRFVATGLWYPWGNVSTRPADAAWYGPNEGWLRDDPSAWVEHDSLRIDDLVPAWMGSANGINWAPHTVSLSTHEYRYEYVGTGAPVRLWLFDTPHWDNTGAIKVIVQRHN